MTDIDDDDADVADDADGTGWGEPLFTYQTPYDVVLRLADEYTARALDGRGDLSVTAREQYREHTRAAFVSGWTRLQLERQQTQ